MNSKLKIRLIISLAILTLSFTIVIVNDRTSNNQLDNGNTNQSHTEEEYEEKYIFVDISGEVKNPDVYELINGSRVYNLINMAGGITEKTILKGVDLARKLTDAEKIVIPKHDLKSDSSGLINEIIIDDTETGIHISVQGAVLNPAIVIIDPQKRVIDVIEATGGLLEQADELSINMAQRLEDGMTIYVPFELSEEEKSSRININMASKDELMTLEGIGEVIAENIVIYRHENGYFDSVEELLDISGIGEKKLDAIREKIVIY